MASPCVVESGGGRCLRAQSWPQRRAPNERGRPPGAPAPLTPKKPARDVIVENPFNAEYFHAIRIAILHDKNIFRSTVASGPGRFYWAGQTSARGHPSPRDPA